MLRIEIFLKIEVFINLVIGKKKYYFPMFIPQHISVENKVTSENEALFCVWGGIEIFFY